jgi:hypothetical protein
MGALSRYQGRHQASHPAGFVLPDPDDDHNFRWQTHQYARVKQMRPLKNMVLTD